MKFSAAIVVTLLASSCEAFTVPHPASTKARFGSSSSSLNFAPKGVPTTETFSKESTKFSTELGVSTLAPTDLDKKGDVATVWNKFCNWITSTDNRLYIGWFGTIMFPTLLAATTCFTTAFIAAPPGKLRLSFCLLEMNTRGLRYLF